jgi:hypothetical protein
MVFETIAYTVPPLRHQQIASIPEDGMSVKFVRRYTTGYSVVLRQSLAVASSVG